PQATGAVFDPLGNPLLPMQVNVTPICTGTATPSISTVVLPVKYHPNEPVWNCFTVASIGTSPMVPCTPLALPPNCSRLTGHSVLANMADLPSCGVSDGPRQDRAARR